MSFLAPLFAGIGAAVSGISSIFSGLGILGKIALVGLQMVVKYAMSKGKKESSGVQLKTVYGEDVNRQVALGVVPVKGHHVFTHTYGPSNSYSIQIFRLSDFPIKSLKRVFFEGNWKSLGALDATKGYLIDGMPSQTWVKVYKGSMTQVGDAYVIANSDARWTADHKYTGCSYVIVTTSFNENSATAPADLLFEVEGAPLYDPRKDTTVGGSGAHRWNDQATWEFTENPFVMAYNLERGLYRGAEKIIGKGISSSFLPVDKWASAMNIADEGVDGELRYRCSILAETGPGSDHASNIDPIMQSCAGSIVIVPSGIYPIAGSVRSVVATLTDEDLVAGKSYRFTRYRTNDTLFNTITGTFPVAEEGYESKPYPPRIDTAAIAFDGQRRATPINFTTVIYPKQIERLADVYQRANRYQASAEITVMPKWFVLEPGDWIVWNSSRHGSRAYEVQEAEIAPLEEDGARNTLLRLQEVSGAIFDATTYLYTPPTTIAIPAPAYASQAANFLASAVLVESPSGEKVPAFRFIWDAFDDVTVEKVLIRYRPVGGENITIKEVSIPTLILVTSENVLSDQDHEYSHMILTSPPRAANWTAWQTIASLSLQFPSVSVGLGQTQSDVTDLLTSMNLLFDDIASRIEQLAHDTSVGTGQNIVDRREFRKQMAGALASIVTESELRVTGDSALASQITALEASIDGTVATALTSLETRVDSVEGVNVAQASAITAVQAQGNQATAQGLLSFAVQSSPNSGSLVTINLMARAALSGTADQTTFKTSGLNIELYLDGGIVKSKVSILTDKFIVSDGTNTGTPLVFEGGVLKLQVAKIGTAIVDQLKSANDKLKITGTTGVASIELFS